MNEDKKLKSILQDIKQKTKTGESTGDPGVNESLCSPDCEICGGSGYYRLNVDLQDERFGKVLICKNVDRSSMPGFEQVGLEKDELKSLSWDTLIDEPGVEKSIQAVRETIKRGHGWVFLYGGFGVGKTFILKIAIAEMIRSGSEASYVRMAEVLDHLRDSFDDGVQERETTRLKFWSKIPILAIDEFDRLRNTEYGLERRFVLMDRRYEDAIRGSTITILASNSDPSKLPGYLYDRIRDGRFRIIHLSGESFRPGISRKGR